MTKEFTYSKCVICGKFVGYHARAHTERPMHQLCWDKIIGKDYASMRMDGDSNATCNYIRQFTRPPEPEPDIVREPETLFREGMFIPIIYRRSIEAEHVQPRLRERLQEHMEASLPAGMQIEIFTESSGSEGRDININEE